MFIDEEYVEEEVEILIEMIKNGTFDTSKCNNFILCSDLEGDYSHNDIEVMQSMFIKKAKEHLTENHPKEYAIWCDWCVHVATVETYRNIMWGNQNYKEDYIKLIESRDIV